MGYDLERQVTALAGRVGTIEGSQDPTSLARSVAYTDHALSVARKAQASAGEALSMAQQAQGSADEALRRVGRICLETDGRLCP